MSDRLAERFGCYRRKAAKPYSPANLTFCGACPAVARRGTARRDLSWRDSAWTGKARHGNQKNWAGFGCTRLGCTGPGSAGLVGAFPAKAWLDRAGRGLAKKPEAGQQPRLRQITHQR